MSDDGPFCYRVHSPVVLIELDHQPGAVFDNPVPSPATMPNGPRYHVPDLPI